MRMADVSSEPPTQRRFQVVGWAAVMSLLLYLDRFCISISTDYIRQDLAISPSLISWLSSAFFFAYALGQVPSGWLTDRCGVRLMLSGYILAWSAFTGLQAFAQSFAVLCLLQLGCGLAQAGAYPAGARLVRNWNPPTSRGSASSLIALGGRAGGALAPLLTAWMMVQFVPASWDSSVTDRTYLNAHGFADRLASTPATPLDAERLAHLRTFLNEDEQRLIAALSVAAQDQAAVTQEDDRQLRSLINRLLDQPRLYEPRLFHDAIEREGRRLGESLARNGALPAEDLRRLNRLLVEVMFPKILGNIYVHGWRPSMLVYGAIGIIVAALFWRGVRDTPQQDPRCNAAERQLILWDDVAAQPGNTPPTEVFPWRAMLTDVSLWGNCLLQFTTNIGWLFLVRTMPTYLSEVHQVPLVTRGWMTSVPIWAGVISLFYGGRWADALVKQLGLKWGRRVPVLITRFTAALGYAICIALSWLVPQDQAPEWFAWVYVAALSLVSLSTDFGIPAIWAFAQDVGGKYTASIHGWGNMWGNLGATVATPLYEHLLGAHTLAEWNLLFCCLGGAYLIGGAGVLVMDPTRPLTILKIPPGSRG